MRPDPGDQPHVSGLFVAHAKTRENADDLEISLNAQNGEGGVELFKRAVSQPSAVGVSPAHTLRQRRRDVATRVLEKRNQIISRVPPPRVLIVHGTLDRARNFGRVRRRLADFHVLLMDRRGYDRSGALIPGNGTARHAADVLAVLNRQPATVVGHSYGGLVALEAAIQAPNLVRSVGVYEPPVPFLDWWPGRFRPGEPGNMNQHTFDNVGLLYSTSSVIAVARTGDLYISNGPPDQVQYVRYRLKD